ncbi:MAG: hypothetical protein SV760_01495 [Halobacteria archaeon]|nr:hypothetical protein [Halobacteria archaeon]
MKEQEEFKDYIKLRLGLVATVAVVVATGIIGLINLISTASIDAFPLYLHAGLGAIVFPFSVFVLEYRGMKGIEALKSGFSVAFGSVFFVVLLSEGGDRIVNQFFQISPPTLFYAVSIALISATVAVMWAQRNYLPKASKPTETTSLRRQ